MRVPMSSPQAHIMIDYYILCEDFTVRGPVSVAEWGSWMMHAREGLWLVGTLSASCRVFVTTEYIGVDTNPDEKQTDLPDLFVTTVHFNRGMWTYPWRTYGDAMRGHAQVLREMEFVDITSDVQPQINLEAISGKPNAIRRHLRSI